MIRTTQATAAAARSLSRAAAPSLVAALSLCGATTVGCSALPGELIDWKQPGERPGSPEPHNGPQCDPPPLCIGQGAGGDIGLEWVENAFETVRTERIGTPIAGRLYAMTFAAMFDAVNGIATANGCGPHYSPALVAPAQAPVGASANASAAAAVAAYTVLVGLAPEAEPALSLALDESLSGLPSGLGPSVDWGRYVGEEVLALRAGDRSGEADVVEPASMAPGVFRTTFNRSYANMAPFAIETGEPYFLGEPPPPLSSAQYATDLNEVYETGSDQDTSAERHDIALQWETPGGTVRPTGSAIQAAVALARSEGTDKALLPTTRLFALVGMAVADTLIPVWHDKALYMTWRPKPAIQRASEDGNPDTLFDPNFETRFGSTGGSPEYASGQAAFTSAVATVLEEFYGSRALSWCFASDSNPSGRCYESARQMGDEGGVSRIYQGVHFRFTVEASRAIGNGVGAEVARTALVPLPGCR